MLRVQLLLVYVHKAGGEHTAYPFWSMCILVFGLLPGTHGRSQRRDAG